MYVLYCPTYTPALTATQSGNTGSDIGGGRSGYGDDSYDV